MLLRVGLAAVAQKANGEGAVGDMGEEVEAAGEVEPVAGLSRWGPAVMEGIESLHGCNHQRMPGMEDSPVFDLQCANGLVKFKIRRMVRSNVCL